MAALDAFFESQCICIGHIELALQGRSARAEIQDLVLGEGLRQQSGVSFFFPVAEAPAFGNGIPDKGEPRFFGFVHGCSFFRFCYYGSTRQTAFVCLFEK